jgi:hypothetical protein
VYRRKGRVGMDPRGSVGNWNVSAGQELLSVEVVR